jgi:predicted Zn-dependent protease
MRLPHIGRFLLFLSFCSFLSPCIQGQDNAASTFNFTKVDTQLLEDVNEFDRQLEKKGLVLHAPELDAYLESVGKQLIGGRPVPEQVEFHFRVMRDPMVNAFALPNGSVYVTTGLLSLLENEAELAAVLGHEISHVYERHSYIEYRSSRKKVLAITVIQGVAAVFPGGANLSVAMNGFCAVIQLSAALSSEILVASIYGYSREMERQADSDGSVALVSANYDPAAMARLFELLDQDQKLEFEPVQGFYHDHPKLTERRAAALDFASAHSLKQPLQGTESEYLKKVAPAITANIQSDINNRRARTAVARATRLTTAMPDEPKYQVLLADSYRALGAKTKAPSETELTKHGQAQDRKEYFKLTEQEEQQRLKEKPEGAAVLRENQEQAERLYQAVIQSNPSFAEAHRGLGFLYEQEAKFFEASTEYRRYLELAAGTSLDRIRIEHRLAAVEKSIPTPAPQAQ